MADSEELRRATHGWSSPLVVRTYDADDRGRRAFEVEARILLVGGGYAPEQQTEDGGHIHVGRLVLTGGFSVLAGRRGIRSRGKFTATFRKLTGPPADLIVERATHGRSNLALFEVAGRDVMAGPFPMRLLSGVPRRARRGGRELPAPRGVPGAGRAARRAGPRDQRTRTSLTSSSGSPRYTSEAS